MNIEKDCNPYCPYRQYYEEGKRYECRYHGDGKINCYYDGDRIKMEKNYNLNDDEGRKLYDLILAKREELYAIQQILVDRVSECDKELRKFKF